MFFYHLVFKQRNYSQIENFNTFLISFQYLYIYTRNILIMWISVILKASVFKNTFVLFQKIREIEKKNQKFWLKLQQADAISCFTAPPPSLSFENNLCEIISITTGTTYTLHACLYTLRSLSDTEYKSVS